MADVDEDRIHNDLLDGEPDDETPDFRSFSALLKSKSTSLPKRGEKDFEPHGTIAQIDVLEHSRHEMHQALSYLRVHKQDRQIKATYFADTGMTKVENPRSKLFQGMGKTDRQGVTWLLPEEALYLLERGDLDVRWEVTDLETNSKHVDEHRHGSTREEPRGISLGLQSAYAVFIGSISKGVSLECYNVYANLKRSGFAVFRAPSWDAREMQKDHLTEQNGITLGAISGTWSWIYELIYKENAPDYGSQVGAGPYRNYPDIYRRLSLVSRHHPTEDKKRISDSDSSSSKSNQNEDPWRVSFFVYKSRENFKKSNPGEPDFRIAVVDAKATRVPSINQLDRLLLSTPQAAPQTSPSNDNAGKMYARLKHGYRNVILAVVDQGIISYLRVADAVFGQEKLYDGAGRSKHGKKFGKRGVLKRKDRENRGGRV